MKALFNTLRGIGHQPVLLQDQVLVLPFGGRILGLAPDHRTNTLWTHAALQTESGARHFSDAALWLNFGGDRAWIAPEVETNFRYPRNAEPVYEVPKSIDPGQYRVNAQDAHAVRLSAAMTVRFNRRQAEVRLLMERTVTCLPESPLAVPADVQFAGYWLQSTLSAAGPIPDGIRPGLWHILQVPGRGKIVVPVRPDAQPRTFIGTPACELAGRRLTCNVVTSKSFKFSIRADDCLGFMLYINTIKRPATLVARRFAVHDRAGYADEPYDDPADIGHVQQVYVDDGALGGFGEMEYHTPALASQGPATLTDTSETWGFTGSAEHLTDLAEQLLARFGG